MKKRSWAVVGALMIIVLVFASAASGCGGGSESATATGSEQQNGELSSGSSPDGESALEEDPAVSKLKAPEEKKAAAEAIRHAADANTGSAFKVTDVRVVDGWARVGLEETGVPLEEAVGFSVYLRCLADDSWEVATCGTDVSPEELPGAPGGIFE